jgi:hypothetical protein
VVLGQTLGQQDASRTVVLYGRVGALKPMRLVSATARAATR